MEELQKSNDAYAPVPTPVVLELTSHHDVRDMSVASSYGGKQTVEFDSLSAGCEIDTSDLGYGCGTLRVEALSEDTITLSLNGEALTVPMGQRIGYGPYPAENPYLSADMVMMWMEFRRLMPREEMIRLLDRVSQEHSTATDAVCLRTSKIEERVLELIDALIEEGDISLYPLKALLASCNNWHSGVIVRTSEFQRILLEGIEHGCLAPDNEEGWDWLLVAAGSNDPTEFMTDMDRYYDILAEATEHGNTIALDIMNTIWEPEQIIEED